MKRVYINTSRTLPMGEEDQSYVTGRLFSLC